MSPGGEYPDETKTVAWICLPDAPCPPEEDTAHLLAQMAAEPWQVPDAAGDLAGQAAGLREVTDQSGEATDEANDTVFSTAHGPAATRKSILGARWAHQVAGPSSDDQLDRPCG